MASRRGLLPDGWEHLSSEELVRLVTEGDVGQWKLVPILSASPRRIACDAPVDSRASIDAMSDQSFGAHERARVLIETSTESSQSQTPIVQVPALQSY